MKTYTVIDNETGEKLTETAIIIAYWERTNIAELLTDYEDTDEEPKPTPELIDKTCAEIVRLYDKYGEFPSSDDIITEYEHLRRLEADKELF